MHWSVFTSRLLRFFNTGVHDIKVHEKDVDSEKDRLLNDDDNDDDNDDNDDDFSDNESVITRPKHRHTSKCNHHHHKQSEPLIDDEIIATKTATISADERV